MYFLLPIVSLFLLASPLSMSSLISYKLCFCLSLSFSISFLFILFKHSMLCYVCILTYLYLFLCIYLSLSAFHCQIPFFRILEVPGLTRNLTLRLPSTKCRAPASRSVWWIRRACSRRPRCWAPAPSPWTTLDSPRYLPTYCLIAY